MLNQKQIKNLIFPTLADLQAAVSGIKAGEIVFVQDNHTFYTKNGDGLQTLGHALLPLEAFVDLTTVALSPAFGDAYIATANGTAATGDSIVTDRIYTWDGTNWVQTPAFAGLVVYNKGDNTLYASNGTAWQAMTGGGGDSPLRYVVDLTDDMGNVVGVNEGDYLLNRQTAAWYAYENGLWQPKTNPYGPLTPMAAPVDTAMDLEQAAHFGVVGGFVDGTKQVPPLVNHEGKGDTTITVRLHNFTGVTTDFVFPAIFLQADRVTPVGTITLIGEQDVRLNFQIELKDGVNVARLIDPFLSNGLSAPGMYPGLFRYLVSQTSELTSLSGVQAEELAWVQQQGAWYAFSNGVWIPASAPHGALALGITEPSGTLDLNAGTNFLVIGPGMGGTVAVPALANQAAKTSTTFTIRLYSQSVATTTFTFPSEYVLPNGTAIGTLSLTGVRELRLNFQIEVAGGGWVARMIDPYGAQFATPAQVSTIMQQSFVGSWGDDPDINTGVAHADWPFAALTGFQANNVGGSRASMVKLYKGATNWQIRAGDFSQSDTWVEFHVTFFKANVSAVGLSHALESLYLRKWQTTLGSSIQNITPTTNTDWTVALPTAQRFTLTAASATGAHTMTVGANAVTIGKASRYDIIVQAGIAVDQINSFVQLVKNGTEVVGLAMARSAGADNIPTATLSLHWQGYLAVGDTLDLRFGANGTSVAELLHYSFSINELPTNSVVAPQAWDVTNFRQYSLTEQNTGRTWIDGKPIYRKVLVVPAQSSQNQTRTIAIGVIVDRLIDLGGYVTDGTVMLPLPFADVSAGWNLSVKVNGQNVEVRNSTMVYGAGYLWIEYTKNFS